MFFSFLDIIICDSENGKPLPVKESFSVETSNIQYPPDDNRWFAIQIMGINSFEYGNNELVGAAIKKNIMFEKLGYTPIMVLFEILIILITHNK